MKISPVKVQIKVLTKKADIGKHLNTIEREMEAEDNPKCRDLQLDYYHLIQTIGSREAITRRFLVIFEYEAVTNRSRNTQRLYLHWRPLFKQRVSTFCTVTMPLSLMRMRTSSLWKSSTPFSIVPPASEAG